jgi:fumarate hydratase class II
VTLNGPRLQENIERSVMMVTALSPVIGYDEASKIAHLAGAENLTLKEAALRSGVSEELYDQVVVPERLTEPGAASGPGPGAASGPGPGAASGPGPGAR